jgi:hypothetical protein
MQSYVRRSRNAPEPLPGHAIIRKPGEKSGLDGTITRRDPGCRWTSVLGLGDEPKHGLAGMIGKPYVLTVAVGQGEGGRRAAHPRSFRAVLRRKST